MKLNCRKLLQNTQNRYIYETLPTHEQDVPPVVATEEKTNLNKVSDVVKESYSKILSMKSNLDTKIEPISAEKLMWEKKIEELRSQLKKDPTLGEVQGDIIVFGDKRVTIKVNREGGHNSYLENKELEQGFISWALEQKQNSQTTDNKENRDKQINA